MRKWGLEYRKEKLWLWRNLSGGAFRLGRHTLKPQPSIEFLGAMLCGNSPPPQDVGYTWRGRNPGL